MKYILNLYMEIFKDIMGKNKKCTGKPLRIAMLGHKTIPSRQGGIEIVVEELCKRMVKQGNYVTVYNRSGHHVSGKEYDIKKSRSYEGIKMLYVPTIDKRGLAAMSSSFFAAVRAAFGKYDVVHFHAEGPCVMIWIPKLFGKRCIATIHGLDYQRAKWGKFARNYILFGEKCAVKYADEIIVLSKSVQDYFKERYNRDTVFIPNGVNKPHLRKASIIKDKFGLDKDSYILFLGRLVPEKGIKYLIEAFKGVDTDKKLVIAGSSSDTDLFTKELKEMAKDDERIIFTGFVQGDELRELYSNAYLYTLPSDLEGMPLSLLEAMSYGNACLISDIDECTSVVEDHAFIFKRSDVHDLKDVLQSACNDTDKVNKLKQKASEFICNKYNWDDVVNETISLYKCN